MKSYTVLLNHLTTLVRVYLCVDVCRAEKSEVLGTELLELERRVDHIRLVCVDTSHKLIACQPAPSTARPDKRRVGLIHYYTLYNYTFLHCSYCCYAAHMLVCFRSVIF